MPFENHDRQAESGGAERPARSSLRGRMAGQSYENWLDAQIREDQEQGHFDNLPGQGKALPRPEPYEALDDSWLAHHVLKQAGFLPDWLELRKEVHAERPAVVAALRRYREERARRDPFDPADAAVLRELESRYVSLAGAINAKIDEHNRRRPANVPELVRIPEDAARRDPRQRGAG